MPVVNVIREENRAGGAGNVALNLISMGAEAVMCGRIGDDVTGEVLNRELAAQQVDLGGLLIEKGYKTPLKNRIISDNQQLVRVDHEQVTQVSQAFEQQMICALPADESRSARWPSQTTAKACFLPRF